MFDGHFRADAERTLKPVGHKLKRAGVTADHLTVLGVLMAVGAAVAIGAGALRLGLVSRGRRGDQDRGLRLPARRILDHPAARSGGDGGQGALGARLVLRLGLRLQRTGGPVE